MRTIFAAAVAACLALSATAAPAPDYVAMVRSLAQETTQSTTDVIKAACCKRCSKGKACGNSCISKDKQCHQPPGCAC